AYGGEPSVDLFRSFLNLGRASDWLTLSNRGGADSMNNETPIIDAEPISVVLHANVADNIIDSNNTSSNDELPLVHLPTYFLPEVGEKSKAIGKRKLGADALREGSHRRARRAPAQASKVIGDASTPLDVDRDPDIHGKFEHVYGVFVPSLTNLLMYFPFLFVAFIQSFLLPGN
ncbi:hypothetical protein Tco_0041262, partial [Tanacetum coccineum]